MDETVFIISFATGNSPYPEYLSQLKRDCENVGLECYTEVLSRVTDKKEATLHKPVFIKNKLLQSEYTVVWVDADTRIFAPFSLPSEAESWDVALTCRGVEYGRYSDGIHVWRFTENALHLLSVWQYLCAWREMCYFGDHKRLEVAISLMGSVKNVTQCRFADLTPCLENSVYINYGTHKQRPFTD